MIKLQQDDAFEIMDRMIEEKIRVDVLITDPPYGKIQGMILQGQEKSIEGDYKIDGKIFFEKAFKITDTVVIFGQNPTYAEMILSSPNYKYEYIGIKNNCAQGFHADKMPLIYTENIAVFINDKVDRIFNKIISSKEIDKELYPNRGYSQQLQKGIMERYDLTSRKAIYQKMPRINRKGVMKLDRRLEFFFFYQGTLFNLPSKETFQVLIDVFKIEEGSEFKSFKDIVLGNIRVFNKEISSNNNEISNTIKNTLYFSKDRGKHFHPTQKPVELMKFLVKTYSNKDDTIFDPFMGSGSTGVAADELERNFIGIELNEEYYNIAKKRIK